MYKLYALPIAVMFMFISCKKETSDPNPEPLPANYDASTFDSNTTNEAAIRANFIVFVNEMKKARVNGVTVSGNTLNNLFRATPSLYDLTMPYQAEAIGGPNGFLNGIATHSGNTYNPNSQANGGTFGGYLFDNEGLELEQMVEKGLFGAMNFFYAHKKLSGNITLAAIDQALALYGSNPSFPNTPTASKTPKPDVFMANYAARRSDTSNVNSLYNKIKVGFIKLQLGVKENNAIKISEGKAEVLNNWEKVNAATIINYCHSVITTMSNTTTTDLQKASALHAAGEAAGFIWGFKGLPAGAKTITDSQIDVIFNLIVGGPMFKIVTSPASELPKFQQIITQLQNIYGFTNSEIESFKLNYVSVQSR